MSSSVSSLLEKARFHEKNSSFDNALICMKKAMFLFPDNVEVYFHRAELYQRIGDFASAILNYRKCLLLLNQKDSLYKKNQHRQNKTKPREKEKKRESKVTKEHKEGEDDTDSSDSETDESDSESEGEEDEEIIGIYDEKIGQVTKSLSVCLDLDGMKLFQLGLSKNARLRFIESITLDRKNIGALFHLACAAIKSRDETLEREGVRLLEQCDSLIPYVNVVKGLFLLQRKKDLLGAKKELDIAKLTHSFVKEVVQFDRLFKSEMEKEKIKMETFFLERNYQKALKHLNYLVQFIPNDYNLFFKRALCLKEMNKYSSSMKDFLKCKAITGGSDEKSEKHIAVCLYKIAVNYFNETRWGDCIEHVSKSIKWFKSVDSYILRGDCYLNMKLYREAISDYACAYDIKKCDRTRMQYINGFIAWGQRMVIEREYTLAEDYFNEALKIDLKAQDAYLHRSKVRFLLHRTPEAIEDIIAYYLLNQENDQINKIVYQTMPQIIHDRKTQDMFRKKFGLGDGGGKNVRSSRLLVLRDNKRRPVSANRGVRMKNNPNQFRLKNVKRAQSSYGTRARRKRLFKNNVNELKQKTMRHKNTKKKVTRKIKTARQRSLRTKKDFTPMSSTVYIETKRFNPSQLHWKSSVIHKK